MVVSLRNICYVLVMISLMFLIIGCEAKKAKQPKGIEAEYTYQVLVDSKEHEIALLLSKEKELLREIETLKNERDSLQKKYEDIKDTDNLESIENIMELKDFRMVHPWDSIIIVSEGGKIEVTDKALMEAASSLFVISSEVTNHHETILLSNIDPYSIYLTNEIQTFQLEVVAEDAVSFPTELPNRYFYVSSDLYSFTQALISKPNYLPKESMESRLLNSGLVYIEEAEATYYSTNSKRINQLVKLFLKSDKKKLSKAIQPDEDKKLSATFYLHGETIKLNIYNKSIEVIDGDDVNWYEVDPFVLDQISYYYHAN